MITGKNSLFEHKTNLAKKFTSCLSLPLASTLYVCAVLKFFRRSESSRRHSSTSSTTISNLPAQSALNWLRKSSLVLKVTLSSNTALRKFKKVVLQVLRSYDTNSHIGNFCVGLA